ncbi:MAG: putative Glycerophosphoryl diester phosphodiesterase [Candidatus Saccharibacteria bacterium]|nr:putative Glycerophosphoryl diester phosphodiesterase [Candidatus Saccharibacteria bacterium]
MLVIGHRGASGLAPENTLEALRAGLESGADMLEFDVRLTSDSIPILAHNPQLYSHTIRRTSFADLQAAGHITTLESVLDEFFGKILLNLEYKPVGDINVVLDMVKKRFIKTDQDWEDILFSSFHVRTLFQLRHLDAKANLALLHSVNPFAFVTYQRRLRLSAVGWHRLHVNNLAIAIAKKADIFTYVYTVNRPQAAIILEQKGIDAVVTDYPDRIAKEF